MNETRNSNLVIGAVLVALGLLFLVGQWFDFDVGSFAWPLFILVPGVLLLAGALFGGKNLLLLAIPGSIVSTIGLILFFQNLTGRFETWAYAWALIPAAVGVGMFLMGSWGSDEASRQRGWNLILTGLGLFVAFGVFFEFFIFGGAPGLRVVGPLVLIALGVYLLMRQRR